MTDGATIGLAERAGLRCELSDDIELLTRIYMATFERQDIAVDQATMQSLRGIAQAVLRTGNGFMGICRDSDAKPLSGVLILQEGRSAYYLIGANDPESRSTGAGTFSRRARSRRSRCCCRSSPHSPWRR